MKKVIKGDPAPYDGYVITHHEYNKILNDKELLNWISIKLRKINNSKFDRADERPNTTPYL